MGANTRVCDQNTKRIFCKDPAQPDRLPGCEFHMNKVKKRMAWTTLYHQEFRAKIGDRAMKERLCLTPGSPRFTARRLENLEDKVSPEEHETYRSGVGTLLFLTKHSRPDICNPVRELCKTIDARSSTFERNVQSDKICAIHKRTWPKV